MADTVWITGGAGGLGIAVARAFSAAGHPVVLADLEQGALDRAAAEVGGEVTGVRMDVTDRADVDRAVAEGTEAAGPPLVLVNGAGIAASAPLLPPDDAMWDRTMAVNATGTWIVSTACLPAMKEAGRGRIVNVASTAALRGYRYTAAYVASKHAVLGLTRAMTEDLQGHDITVNAVCPGFLDTPMTDRTVAKIVESTGATPEHARGTLARMNPSGRLIRPDEVAELVVELAADGARRGEAVRLD